jgi:hypothetical protein
MIKQILMETARDEGVPGEDNDYGWGFIDAYAAVQRAAQGFGRLEGQVTNRSHGYAPLRGAVVRLADTERRFRGDRSGFYRGAAPPALYRAIASVPGFAPDTATVTLAAGLIAQRDFALTDISGPEISVVPPDSATLDTLGPYRVHLYAFDQSEVAALRAFYRVDGGRWRELPLHAPELEGGFEVRIPGASPDTRMDYFVQAVDGAGLTSAWPEGGRSAPATVRIYREAYGTDFDDGPAAGWQVGDPSDQASSGVWVQAVPVGTTYEGRPIQPGEDHTPGDGGACFVTGNGSPGGDPGENDVDGGCTTLFSPVFDLPGKQDVVLSYWRWFAQAGANLDDTLRVDISSDGGSLWLPLERVVGTDSVWHQAFFRVEAFLASTDHVRLRFRACDLGDRNLVEAALDDVRLGAYAARAPMWWDTLPGTFLMPPAPNPSHGRVGIRFRLEEQGRVAIRIFDAAGRLVRLLEDAPLPPGPHEVIWDGRDGRDHRAAAGVYFCRFQVGGTAGSRRLVLIR